MPDVIVSAVIGGLAALGGVAFGWIGSSLQEASRRRHERATRWHDERLRSYSAVLAEAAAFERAMTEHSRRQLLVEKGLAEWGPTPPRSELDLALERAEILAAHQSGMQLALVGLRAATLMFPDQPDVAREEWREAAGRIRDMREQLIDAARVELEMD